MDKETWSLVLSIIGLALGAIAAYAQLKAIAHRAVMAGGTRAKAWMARMNDSADLYSKNPSAAIAYLATEIFSVLKYSILTIALLAVIRSDRIGAPTWLGQTIMLLVAAWIGNKLADMSLMMRLALRKARDRHASDS